MPWWSWVLIWGGLVVLLLGVLALCIIRLYRKGMAALREFDRLEQLQADAAALAESAAATREQRQQDARRPVALGRHHAEVVAEHRRIRLELAQRRSDRRARRHDRARALLRADALQYQHLVTPTPKD